MDGNQFDAWARRLAPVGSRRHLVQALASAWATGAGIRAGLLAVPGAAAPCKGTGKPCDKNGDCCGGLTCKNGKCRCKRSTKACGDGCCGKNEQCVGKGNNQTCCPAQKVCEDTCCGPHRTCVCPKPPDIPGTPIPPCFCRCESGWTENLQGECVCETELCGLECCETDKGERCCDGAEAEVCTNVKISERHCGACGHACPEHHACVGGTCVCAAGYIECEGKCIKHELGNCCSDRNCHEEPYPCLDPNPPCFPSVEDFPAHTICCENVCRANFKVEDHCGACGNRCDDGEMCCGIDAYHGQCLPFAECCAGMGDPGQYVVCVAPRGQSASAHCCDSTREACCDGHCTSLDSFFSCGACGNTCGTGQICCDLPSGNGGPTCLSKAACRRRGER